VIEMYKPVTQRAAPTTASSSSSDATRSSVRGSEVGARKGSLVVKALHLELCVRRSGALDEAFERALDSQLRTVGLERVVR
jgi:hypothetical protein